MAKSIISNPNGLPRPFRRKLGMSSAILMFNFKPERASQAIPTSLNLHVPWPFISFQTRTGFPGHSDVAGVSMMQWTHIFQTRTGFPGHSDLADLLFRPEIFVFISNPNGLPRP